MLKKHEQIMKDMKGKTCSELASRGPHLCSTWF
jgi:hypothetical protein